jgi:hypothetical protein
MVAIPDSENSIQNLIDEAYAQKTRSEEKTRPHMGISMIGHPCERWMWLSFRWAVKEEFNGRMYRLFNRGHREEDVLISLLEMIGVEFSGQQAHVDFGFHVSGSADGVIERGVPGALQTRHVAEFKTHSLKSFNDVAAKGVLMSKPMHYAQMQGYMHGMFINRALYVAICKDDDRIYTERVHYDKKFAERLVERAQRVATADRIPEPISTDPSWYQCKFCPAHSFCHEKKPTKHVNCRTCAFSTAEKNSTWTCERHDASEIPVDFQLKGCDDHVLHPDMVPWKVLQTQNQWTICYVIDGNVVENGTPDAAIFSSREILANAKGCADETVKEIRRMWKGAEVVG